MSESLLTTSDVAVLMGVGATSVKRWADARVLRCVKTAGGHRRFMRGEVERFLRSQLPEEEAYTDPLNSDGWLRTLREPADALVFQAKLLELRARRGSWWRAAEDLSRTLVRLGEASRDKEISVVEEHIATEALHRALAATSAQIPLAPSAPRALLALAPEDTDILGLSLAELTAREAGWSTIWAGAGTPVDELIRWASTDRVDLLVISASLWSAGQPVLERAAMDLASGCAQRGTRLILVGPGCWPDLIPGAKRARDFQQLHDALQR